MAGPLDHALVRLFDDAGLFPPARLPMAEALAAHARALDGPHHGVVGPFLCPVGRLAELEACVAAGAARPPALGLIGHDGPVDWGRALATPGVVQVEAPLGVRMPAPPANVLRYLELPHHGDVQAALDAVEGAGARAKVRCGGLTPDAVPRPSWLAEVLVGCATRGLPLKATAGLHQPYFRARGPEGARHGFVNLLAAAAAAVGGATVTDVTAVLTYEEPAAAVLPSRLQGARRLLASIGTCSIDEPLAALAERGLL